MSVSLLVQVLMMLGMSRERDEYVVLILQAVEYMYSVVRVQA